MRLIFDIDWLRLGFLCALTPSWSRWFLPINLTIVGYLTSAEATLSVLWFFHIGIRFPLFRPYRRAARHLLPKYKGL
jgi:hypothetical protein